MANLLDEVAGLVNDAGRGVHIIDKQLPVEAGFGSTLFQTALWVVDPVLVSLFALLLGSMMTNPLLVGIVGYLVRILPGVIFISMKISARNHFQKLEQRTRAEASNTDNYLERYTRILQNIVELVERAIDLDKDVMKAIAALRSGSVNEGNRSDVNAQVNTAFGRLFPQIEAYLELKTHNAIADAMQQNNYLQREITTVRTVYNSCVIQWNTDIFSWPIEMIITAQQGYTTRIPFTATVETREAARGKFF